MSNLKHMSLDQLQKQKAASIKDIGKWQGKKNNEQTRLNWINTYIKAKTVKEINWNEAPKDATHYEPSGNCITNGWMKKIDDYWSFHVGNNNWDKWMGNQARIDRMIPRPDDNSAATIDEITQAEINAGNLPWNGEGLPPVGTECLFRIKAIENINIEYCPCTILFSGKENIVFEWERRGERLEKACHKNEFDFKPLQTKQDELVEDCIGELFTPHEGAAIPSADYHMVRKMIKAGYRKILDNDIKLLKKVSAGFEPNSIALSAINNTISRLSL